MNAWSSDEAIGSVYVGDSSGAFPPRIGKLDNGDGGTYAGKCEDGVRVLEKESKR